MPLAVRLPLTTLASSVTSGTVGSPITAASLAPWMVKLICLVVPSSAVTVKVSTLVSPAPRILHRAVGDRVGVAAVGCSVRLPRLPLRARHGGLERRLVLIGIGDRDRAGRRQVAVDDIGVLGHIVNRRIADHRRVVGAVDGEADLLGRAVKRRHREGVDLRVAGAEKLHRAVGDR